MVKFFYLQENRVATTTANLKEVTDENNNLKSTVAQLEEQLASLRKEREGQFSYHFTWLLLYAFVNLFNVINKGWYGWCTS